MFSIPNVASVEIWSICLISGYGPQAMGDLTDNMTSGVMWRRCVCRKYSRRMLDIDLIERDSRESLSSGSVTSNT